MGMRVVSFKADEELIEMLEHASRELRVSKSALIRIALRAYLDQERFKHPFVTRRIRIWG